ncbi:tetratricopeptide repeat protein [candidate division KSB1 bacterium]|nr:tetratricopeptide repeat protein [candidate division KSB1 bacterium]
MENNNNRGYAAVYYSWPFLGLADYAPGNNVIQGNGNYELQDLNPYGIINAICNYWGTTDTTEIENMIYTNNTVNFIPFLLAPPNNLNLLAGATGLNNSLLSKTVLSSDPDEYNQKAIAFLIKGNYEKARGLFQYVIENYPDSDAAKYALVHITTCYDKLGERSNVVPYLEGIAESYSKLDLSTFALALSVSTLEKTGDYKQAEERCLQLMESSKDENMNKNLLFVLANIYSHGLNEKEKAKQYFEEYINKYPKDELAQIARCMLEMDDFRFIPKGDEPEKTQEKIAPATFALSQNYPNPFNPETEISFQIPNDTRVSLVIYNLLGQKIRTLVNKEMATGYHTIKWRGRDDFGNAVASGVYLYAIQAGEFFDVKKMVLMR